MASPTPTATSPAPPTPVVAGAAVTMDRFLVLSLLEDLQFPPPAEDPLFPSDSKRTRQTRYDELFVSSPTGSGVQTDEKRGFGDDDASRDTDANKVDSNLLTAGEQTDGMEEPCERQLARVRAISHLPALARKMGPRWVAAELVPYLLRCCEADTEALGFAVAKVLPSLMGLCTVALPPPPTAIGGGFVAKASKEKETGEGSSDGDDATNTEKAKAGEPSQSSAADEGSDYTFSSRSQKALEASLAVTTGSMAHAIANTTYYAALPTPQQQSQQQQSPTPATPSSTTAVVNHPAQHVITPNLLAPVLLGLASSRSVLVRRFVADVTIPSVCFGVPFAIHYPLFPLCPAGGGANGSSGGGEYSSMGKGRGAMAMPSPYLGGSSVEEGLTLGLLGGGTGDSASADYDDLYFVELMRLAASSSSTAPTEFADSLTQLIDKWSVAAEEDNTYGGGSSSSSLSSCVDPFEHSARRTQVHSAVMGALARQDALFGPHSHTYRFADDEGLEEDEGGEGGGSNNRNRGGDSSIGLSLFAALLREMLTRGSGTTGVSMFSSSSGSGSTNSPWPSHVAMAVRLVANLVKLVTTCGVEHVKSLGLLLGRQAVQQQKDDARMRSSPSSPPPPSSSSSSSYLFPAMTSCDPYSPFEERAIIASFFQETVPLQTIVGCIEMVAGAVLDARPSSSSDGADSAASSAAVSRTTSIAAGGGIGGGSAAALNPASNPFIAGSSSSSSSSSFVATAKFRLRYPMPLEGISAAIDTLIPTLALKEHCKLIERLVGNMGALTGVMMARGHQHQQHAPPASAALAFGYCGVPTLGRLMRLPASSTSFAAAAGPNNNATASSSSSSPSSSVTALSSIDHLLLSTADVSSMLYDVMALPIPTASAAVQGATAAAGTTATAVGPLGHQLMAGRGGMGSISTAALQRAGMMGAYASSMAGSVSRQPSIQQPLSRGGGGHASSSSAPSSSSPSTSTREPKTMFNAVSAARTSHTALEQLMGGGGGGASGDNSGGTPWSIPTSGGGGSQSPLQLHPIDLQHSDRLALLWSRSFGGHYYAVTALCFKAFAMVAKRYGFLLQLTALNLGAVQQNQQQASSASLVMMSSPNSLGGNGGGGGGGGLSSPNSSSSHHLKQVMLPLLTFKNGFKSLSTLLVAAQMALVQPSARYFAWRSRYAASCWMPTLAAVVGNLAERMGTIATSVVPDVSSSSLTAPSSSDAAALSAGMRLLRDAVGLWRNTNAMMMGSSISRSGSSSSPSSSSSSSSLAALKVTLSADDYSRLASLFTRHLWPLVRSVSVAVMGSFRTLIALDVEEEVKVCALERLLLSGGGGGGAANGGASNSDDRIGSSSSNGGADGGYISPICLSAGGQQPYFPNASAARGVPAAATTLLHLSTIVTPLAKLSDAIADAAAERWRHTSHQRTSSSSAPLKSVVSLLPPSESAMWAQPISYELLGIISAALGKDGGGRGGGGGGGIIITSDLPPNVSERTRAAVPIGLTQLLRDCWRCGYAAAAAFAANGTASMAASPTATCRKGLSPIALYPMAYTVAAVGGGAGGYAPALNISPANEEDLRYIYHSLTEDSKQQQSSVLPSDYRLFKGECSKLLASLAQDKGPLVQIGIVNAMMQLLSSSSSGGNNNGSSSSQQRHADPNSLAIDDVAMGGSGSLMSPTTASVISAAQQPNALDRVEMEVFVSEMCGKLVRSDVWRVREAFGPTLAKAIVAYVVPAVLLGVERLRAEVRSGGGGMGSWTLSDALFYERIFAEVLGLAAPAESTSDGGPSSSAARRSGSMSSATATTTTTTSPALILANYEFAVAELFPLFSQLVFDRTKAVRDSATDAAACLACTVRKASEVFDVAVRGSGVGANNTMMPTRDYADYFVNHTFYSQGIAESPQASQHNYLMRVQLLTVAVTVGVDKASILLPLLKAFAKDPIVNVRMAVGRAVGALSAKQREVEGPSSSSAALMALYHQGSGGADGQAPKSAAAVVSSSSSSASTVIRRSLLSINPNTAFGGGVGGASSSMLMGSRAGGFTVASATTNAATAPVAGSAADPIAASSVAPSALLMANCFYYHFTREEVEDVLCAALLRPMLEDSSEDVRDVAGKAFALCY